MVLGGSEGEESFSSTSPTKWKALVDMEWLWEEEARSLLLWTLLAVGEVKGKGMYSILFHVLWMIVSIIE